MRKPTRISAPDETLGRALSRRALVAGLPLLLAGCVTADYSGFHDNGFGLTPVDTTTVDPGLLRTEVDWKGHERPGSIVVNISQRRLYLVEAGGKALRYGIGVGRDGFGWSGRHHITAKKEWPSWTPPAQMRARRPDLPRYLAGGIENPLGARAMYLGSTLYRIHGSNEPETIGHAVSSGCIRMTNEDVTDLYNRVSVGTLVVVR
jgi:lipoprotein-anchoring transpeptidase ErfK/SrfK